MQRQLLGCESWIKCIFIAWHNIKLCIIASWCSFICVHREQMCGIFSLCSTFVNRLVELSKSRKHWNFLFFFLCLAFRICNGTLNSFQSISTIGLNVVDFQFICVECTKSAFDKIHFPLPLEVIISTQNKNVVVWFLFMQKWLTFSPNQKVLFANK